MYSVKSIMGYKLLESWYVSMTLYLSTSSISTYPQGMVWEMHARETWMETECLMRWTFVPRICTSRKLTSRTSHLSS